MRTSTIVFSALAAAALSASACSSGPTSLLGSSGDSTQAPAKSSGSPAPAATSTVTFAPDTKDALAMRTLDYSEALRTASLKLVSALPTLAQVKHVALATDKKAAYESELDTLLADPRFAQRMIKWWQDTMRLGGGAQNDQPSRDTAPTFAARVVVEEQPFSEIFTAPSNTCPTYDMTSQAFVDGECQSGAPAVSGVLTDPGAMFQFYGDMAFRRVRWVQEIFVCNAFPAEISESPVAMGSAVYTSPWPFASVSTSPINFQDTSSVICANCHTTINHIAPLFANFDQNGQYQSSIQVMTPTSPNPQTTQMSDWLVAGESTHWRHGEAVADLVGLGQAIAADPDVAACAVTRAYNFAFSKQDVVTDLAQVPPSIIDPWIAEFQKNGQNFKKTLRDILASDDFVRF